MTTESADRAGLERARQLSAAGHQVEAERIARQVLASEPGSVRALVLLARTLVAQGRGAEAMRPAQEACRIDPQHVNALLILSHAASRSGRSDLAVEVASRAVTLSPHDAATHYTLANALLSDRHHAAQALRAADEAVRLAPTWADAHNIRGLCLSRMGLRADARAAYEHVLALEPGHALALSNLAALDVKRRPMAAAKKLTIAVGMDPQQAIIQNNLRAATHNFVLHLQWLVVAGGLVEGAVVLAGGTRTLRMVVVAALGALVLVAACYFLAQLPRGYRRSAVVLIRSMGQKVGVRLIFLGIVAAIVCVVAFGGHEAAEANTGRLVLLVLVGGVATLIRRVRARSRP